jgi:hypothetical protein
VEPDKGLVVTVNVALVAPPATVTVDGTVADDGLPLDSDTTAPPAGAGPLSVTVPVEGLPPTTLDGFTPNELNPTATGVTVRGAVRVTPPYTAEIVTAVEPDTGLVVTGNVALVAPAATVTLDGTVAANVLSLLSDTTAPPAGAGPLSVTVPVEGLPPTTLDGFTPNELNPTATGVTVRGAVRVTPP